MPDSAFMSALQKATSGGLSLAGLISAADEFNRAGRTDQADQLYKIWIEFNPHHPHLYAVHFNRSVILSKDDGVAAEGALRAAIALNPDFMPAYINLGRILENRGAPIEAISLWTEAVDRFASCTGANMDHKAMTLKQMSRVLLDLDESAKAEIVLLQCLELNPGQRDAVGQYVPLRLSQCKWPVVVPNERIDRATLMAGIQPLSIAAYTDDPMLQLAAAWRHVELEVDEHPADHRADRRRASIDLTGRRMRIGYVSSDLRDHAIGYLMAELFELHDKSQVEVFAYYCGIPSDSPLTKRTKAAVEHWIDIRDLSDDAAAARIAADGIDILVDVNGLTKDARTAVFARRPAPVQVNWLGFPGSMGTPYHHYIIADDWIIPKGSEHYYSEAVVRLPCYQSNDRKRIVAKDRPSRADAGLPDDAFVFCCFNGSQKITRFTFDRWVAILQRTPGSVLWLLESNKETQERLAAYAAERGVEQGRIVFAPKRYNPLHMARYPLADLFLDTSPYGAHTTASDALWMGVPVLTLSGRSFAARVCGSLVRAAGLPELICETPADYVERAVWLAGEGREELLGYRRRLEAGRDSCVLFDMDGLARHLEALYRTMGAEHQAGRTPQPDLRNLGVYLDIAVQDDHEAIEMQTIPDYDARFKAKLAVRHRTRPIPPDARLWTQADVAAADRADPEVDSPSAEAPPADVHPLLKLSQLYDAGSLLLCEPLTETAEAQVDSLFAQARALAVDVPAGSDWAGWEKHYRLLVEAADPRWLHEPIPEVEGEPAAAFAAASGESLDWAEVQATADRLGVEAVFFAAADEAYIDLYARLYIQSILKHSDVRSLVVVHVIGGTERLKTIAETLGIEDERLIFAGDRFDADAVATRCYDSPPKGLIEKPVAHFQSVRFLRVKRLLSGLKRPIFVSDIDLLLQRGVSDLLARCSDADVVFNENEGNTNAGSRLTANLLLFNPTVNAATYLDFLGRYLSAMLAKPEVTRWIDQFGLLMSRQHLYRAGDQPNIQYFDTNVDINNVMYRSYQQNPFRFLSLYHGFDLSSLEGEQGPLAANIAAE